MVGSAVRSLSQMELPSDIDQARHKLLVQRFQETIGKAVECYSGPLGRQVRGWVQDAIDIIQGEPLSVRRDIGLKTLSNIIMAIYVPHMAEDGSFKSLPLRYPEDIRDDSAYTTYFPSVTSPDAHPDAQILLVGEAPAFVETKIGVPLADLWNAVSSSCGVCRNFERCLLGTALLDKRTKPEFDRRLYGCEYEPSDRRRVSPAMYCYTAGEILRQILVSAGVARASWGKFLPSRYDVLAVATNVKRTTSLKRAGNGFRNEPSDPKLVQQHAPWLWLEAAMMLPKATVLLGSIALAGYQACSGSKKGSGSGLIDYTLPFGAVYKTYHPSYLLRLDGGLCWRASDELSLALSENVSRQQVASDPRWKLRTALVHVHDTILAAANYTQSQHILDERAGYTDIIQQFVIESIEDVVQPGVEEG